MGGDTAAFGADLNAWLTRHGLTFYAAERILEASEDTIARWSRGGKCQYPKAMLALMEKYDAGVK